MFLWPKFCLRESMVRVFCLKFNIRSALLFLCFKSHRVGAMLLLLSKSIWCCALSVQGYTSSRHLCLFAQIYPRGRTCFISSQSCHTTAYVSLVQKRDTRHKWCASYPKIEIKSAFLFLRSKETRRGPMTSFPTTNIKSALLPLCFTYSVPRRMFCSIPGKYQTGFLSLCSKRLTHGRCSSPPLATNIE